MGTIFLGRSQGCQTCHGLIQYMFQIHMLARSKYSCQIRVKDKQNMEIMMYSQYIFSFYLQLKINTYSPQIMKYIHTKPGII